jgi:methylase of polypeptide subunit release factors
MNRGEVFTPPETVKFMVEKLGEVNRRRILEPGAGEGVFVKELLRRGVNPEQITAFDTNPDFGKIYQALGINYRISDFLLHQNPIEFPGLFDCVIGNPPYLSRHSTYIQTHKKSLLKRFKEIGVYDTYSLFIYHGLRFLKEGGILCFIVSDTFLTIEYHQKLRHLLLENYELREIVSAPKNLFAKQGVNNTPCIIVVEKKRPDTHHQVAFVDRLKNEQEYRSPTRTKRLRQQHFLKIRGYPISINADSFVAELFSSLPSINEVMEGHIGLHTHNNRKFIAAIQGTKLADKFAKEERTVIPRSFPSQNGKWRPYLKKGGKEQYYREIEEAIDWSPEAVTQYDIPKKGDLFLREGIIISGVSRKLAARYMPKGCLWDSNKAIGFVSKKSEVSIWYLLGVLNSRLYNFLAKGVLNTTNCLQIDDIRRLPFKYPSQEAKSSIETGVKQIVKNLKKNPGYDYSKEQAQIDELIFELYEAPKGLRDFIETKYQANKMVKKS